MLIRTPGLVICVGLAASIAAAGLATSLLRAEVKGEDFDFFEKKIRPVLAERCYQCHSTQSEKLKGGLLLDMREGLLKGGESGKPAVVPGDAERSRLIEAIRYTNEDLQMPPPKQGKLNDQQIEDIVSWVNQGAPDPRTNALASLRPSTLDSRLSTNHWAFQPPAAHPIPAVKHKRWPQTPIDHFILAGLEAKGLQPSLRADQRTLIRRATYDLTGLPPTSAEVEAFLHDESPEAFARVVDRLLASPRYGERWGRHWLDVARFADTKGYVYGDREEGRFVHSHAYRDWVIRAFNDDMPYDRFLMLQLAADQLPPSTLPPAKASERRAGNPRPSTINPDLAAMGFLTLGRRFLGVVHDIIDDRIDVVMRGTQGLTVGCARCHDHKYDPIPTRDYYSLYGVFLGSYEELVPLEASYHKTEDDVTFEKGLEERQEKLKKTYQAKRDALTDRLRAKAADYLLAVLDADRLPTEVFYEIRGPDDLNPVIVRQWQAYLRRTAKDFHRVFALWHAYAALPAENFAAKAASIRERVASESEPRQRMNPVVLQAFAGTPPASMREVAQRYGRLFTEIDQAWRQLTKPPTNSISDSTLRAPHPTLLPDPAREELRQVLYGPESPASVPPGPIVEIEWFFDEGGRVELAKLQAEIERWIIKSPGALRHAVILEDRPAQRNPQVFIRGNPANKGEEVPRQFLGALAGPNRQPFKIGSGRLELARAIASPSNPLTARVMVNRLWLHHFGAGLVRTPSDFGTRCEPPTHPELLDWLAVAFMSPPNPQPSRLPKLPSGGQATLNSQSGFGWSIKKLHRLIMLSSVYQQRSDSDSGGRTSPQASTFSSRGAGKSPVQGSSGASPSQIDPENRLLWRMNRQRLDFEAMRDSLLAVSGELEAKMGGKPVELFKQPFSTQRAIYGFIDRQFLPGVLRVFDFANPDMHSPDRPSTTVPQQALFFMNSPFVLDRARALASRAQLQKPREPADRIQKFYEFVYQRRPTSRQIEAGVRFLKAAEAEPPAEPHKPVVSAWQYGHGEYDEMNKRVKNFEKLPHFTGEAWQGGPKWPDDKLGWVQLTAAGGHAGNDLQHAAIRRWVAPCDAVISINGTVHHEHKEGDGIRALLVSGRNGLLGSWTLHNDKAETKVDSVEVKQGDTIDFVVDYRANLNSDDFNWSPVIKLGEGSAAVGGSDYVTEWNAKKEFSGPPEPPTKALTPWERYAQVLLLANEFMFVD